MPTTTTKPASAADKRAASRGSRIISSAKAQVPPKTYSKSDLWVAGLGVYSGTLTLGLLYLAIWH